MNTIQIEHFLKKNPYAGKILKKACASDQLKHVIYPSTMSLIVIHFLPGELWVAMYFDKNGKGEYFDSYGLSPQLHRFTDLMNRDGVLEDVLGLEDVLEDTF